jgi:3-oxoacyl-[acyl-carrier protein] reductase
MARNGRRLEGKAVIVTGGTRGVGHALVRKLAQEGADVAFSYIKSETAAQELISALSGQGGRVIGQRADVRDRGEIDALVASAVSEFGHIDVLVNNAHLAYDGKWFEDAEWDDFQIELDTLVKGPFNTIQAVLPHMKAQGSGSIVNVGSTMALSVRPRHSFYIAAKNALWGLTLSLALEFGPHGIRVNMVTPGPLDTDHNAAYTPEMMKRLGEDTPLRGRIGTPEEVADAVVLMALDESRLVTGANVLASGGLSIA